jgi:sulfur-carrier protein
VRVHIPTPLLGYTASREVTASGTTLAAVLDDLDRQYRGIRFRMVDEQGAVRPHMRVFVNGTQVKDLARTLQPEDVVHIVQALSGG